MTEPIRLALCGDILHFQRDPGWDDDGGDAARFEPDGWLLVEDGRVQAVRAADQPPDARWTRHDWRGHLILPGFIDTHVHAPQLDVIGSYGAQLLDWLQRYTFPAEARYADPEQSRRGAERFLHALLAHGTTAALVYATVHKTSSEALFATGQALGMRLVTGKVLMDRNCPDDLRDDVAQAERDCVDLIDRWHGVDRLAYAVTPRFAATSSRAQLSMAARLLDAYRDRAGGLYMQTHVAESRDEVRWVAELFPESRSYLDVYAAHGLLGARSVLAHGIWLDDADRALLREAGRRSPSVPRPTCSSAAACSTGPGRAPPGCAWRRPATWAAAPACAPCAPWPTATRCLRCRASACRPGRACTPPRWARRRRLDWRTRSGTSRPERWPTSSSGAGPTAPCSSAGRTWHAACMSACSRG
ncbi:guanine deaminase [mine drainage metagenome]|uniref:Guanine deaminase n=1 Tax=mine drainage metagenome TaxID=410659 RepID=A0A1J5QV30_9ZZZZ